MATIAHLPPAFADIASKAYVERTTVNTATKEYVNQAIANVPTGITQEQLNAKGYVTQAQLDAAIANAIVNSVTSRQCNITYGNGAQLWSGSGWGACNVVGCNTGYYISDTTHCTVCPDYATCAGGTGATAVCLPNNEYFVQNSTVCDYVGPTACMGAEYSDFSDETTMTCNNSNAGTTITITLGVYCANQYSDTNNLQTCTDCVPASETSHALGAGGDCYCKIHSVNGAPVSMPLFKFAIRANNCAACKPCAQICSYECARLSNSTLLPMFSTISG